jgi:hypothetical protein
MARRWWRLRPGRISCVSQRLFAKEEEQENSDGYSEWSKQTKRF